MQQYDPLQISLYDYKCLDFEDIKKRIHEVSICTHRDEEVIFYTVDYCNGGICVEFSHEYCDEQGVVYLSMDYKILEVDYVVMCSLCEEIVIASDL